MPNVFDQFDKQKQVNVFNQFDDPEKENTFGSKILGGLEAAATIGSSIIAEPIAGLAGIAAGLNPSREEGSAAKRVKDVRESLTYQPESKGAQAALEMVGSAIEPAARKLSEFEGTLGDYVLETTGSPELAAIAHTLPTATIELLGAGLGRKAIKDIPGAEKIKQAKKAAVSSIEGSEDLTGIRKLTTDVLPPETRAGSFMQQQGELISGGQRKAQQAERVKAIDNLLGNYNVDDAARFELDIVESVKNSIDKVKAKLGVMYEDSTAKLDNLGVVPISNTKKFAQKVIDKEAVKGTLADASLVKEMQGFIDAPADMTFDTVKSVRSSVGTKLKQAKQGAPVQGSSDTGLLSQMYKNLSNDMKLFADSVDPKLAAKWKQADAEFSGFATGANRTGAKRLIKDGTANPEIVDQLLFSTKKSDMDFLNSNLDVVGKQAAKQRVLQRMLQKSSPDGIEINPNRFQTQMNKQRNQIKTFFSVEESKALDSLRDALNETRRAQDASVTTTTGQQLVPLFAITNPQVLIPGVAQAIIEKPFMRNLLIKRKAAKTALARNKIDVRLQKELRRSGLLGAATAGAITNDR